MSAPLLFLGHAADRTGPPIYLLHVLRWLRAERPEVDFEVALLAGGELEAAFEALAPTSVHRGIPTGFLDRIEREWLLDHLELEERWWRMRREQALRQQMLQHAGCRVVYANGAPSIELARALPPGDRVLLSHVHELEIGLTRRLEPRDRRLLLEGADRVFVVADAVRRELVERHHVNPAIIARHPGMVDMAAIGRATSSPDARAAARARRGLPAEGLIVGAAGTLEWRKGVDLFLWLAHRLRDRPRTGPVTFTWIGGSDADVDRYRRVAANLGVDDVVRFVGEQPDPLEWFRLLDVFVLPSREDPFPLVCLEAAAVGVPVVAFDTGGIPELLVQGCGLVATYPDLDDLAVKVLELLDDQARRTTLGTRGHDLMCADHDVTILAPRLWADIERWLP
jgi:glycosyltransferase involved in cell wall biosynthesis